MTSSKDRLYAFAQNTLFPLLTHDGEVTKTSFDESFEAAYSTYLEGWKEANEKLGVTIISKSYLDGYYAGFDDAATQLNGERAATLATNYAEWVREQGLKYYG